jgi:hypothetical protein
MKLACESSVIRLLRENPTIAAPVASTRAMADWKPLSVAREGAPCSPRCTASRTSCSVEAHRATWSEIAHAPLSAFAASR